MTPVNVLLVMGCFLIVSGVALIAYQIKTKSPPSSETAASPVHTGRLSASSPYPGVILVAFGVILLLAAAGAGHFSN
jgi:uncharacterized membrane protein HdeD (DUF308 family)